MRHWSVFYFHDMSLSSWSTLCSDFDFRNSFFNLFLTETTFLLPCSHETSVVATFIRTEVNGHLIATAPQDTRFLFAAAFPKLITETVTSVTDFEIIKFALGTIFIGDWVLKFKVWECELDAWSRFHFQVMILPIPHICHGSHGYTRVNFFWPV